MCSAAALEIRNARRPRALTLSILRSGPPLRRLAGPGRRFPLMKTDVSEPPALAGGRYNMRLESAVANPPANEGGSDIHVSSKEVVITVLRLVMI